MPSKAIASGHNAAAMMALAATMRGSRAARRASMSSTPRRLRMTQNTTAWSHAAAEVASAIPTWPMNWNSARLSAVLVTTTISVTRNGVPVSSRAKKPGDSTLTSTKAGKPNENANSARAVASVSAAVNAPRWNSTSTIGQAITRSAAVAGRVSSSETSIARDWLSVAAAVSPARRLRASIGNNAVPTAIPTTPSGS